MQECIGGRKVSLDLIEQYLSKVDFHLIGMAKNVRKDIVAELKVHILDSVKELGGLSEENVQSAISKMADPKEIAARYKQIYGYAQSFKILFAIGGFLLAILTLPVLPAFEGYIYIPMGISSFLLVLVIFYLIYVSIKAGKMVGLAVGIVSSLSRISYLLIMYITQKNTVVINSLESIVVFLLISLIMVLIGYLPGGTKEKWESVK